MFSRRQLRSRLLRRRTWDLPTGRARTDPTRFCLPARSCRVSSHTGCGLRHVMRRFLAAPPLPQRRGRRGKGLPARLCATAVVSHHCLRLPLLALTLPKNLGDNFKHRPTRTVPGRTAADPQYRTATGTMAAHRKRFGLIRVLVAAMRVWNSPNRNMFGMSILRFYTNKSSHP